MNNLRITSAHDLTFCEFDNRDEQKECKSRPEGDWSDKRNRCLWFREMGGHDNILVCTLSNKEKGEEK